MKIISLKRGFEADHSSSSYEFFALNPLTPDQRKAIQKLTGKSLRGRRLALKYMGEWQDIPLNWASKLLSLGYDIMVSESYDWWSIDLALSYDPDLYAQLEPYQCEAENGFEVEPVGEQMVLHFRMQLDYGVAYDEMGSNPFKGLANLFEQVRTELLSGDLSAAWAIYDTYGYGDEETPEPVEPLSASGETLLNIMESY